MLRIREKQKLPLTMKDMASAMTVLHKGLVHYTIVIFGIQYHFEMAVMKLLSKS